MTFPEAGTATGDLSWLPIGLDEFSVVPNVLPEIKKIIRSVKYSDARKIARKTLTMRTDDEIKDYLKGVMKKKFRDIPIG